jgi:hypothetical protein
MTKLRKYKYEHRRLVKHQRTKGNCECCICWRELQGLPPMETQQEMIASMKFEEREIKRAKKKAKMEVKEGSQATMTMFFSTK